IERLDRLGRSARRVEHYRALGECRRDLGIRAPELELERLGVELDALELDGREILMVQAHLLEVAQLARRFEVRGHDIVTGRDVGELAERRDRVSEPRAKRADRLLAGLTCARIGGIGARAALAELDELADPERDVCSLAEPGRAEPAVDQVATPQRD